MSTGRTARELAAPLAGGGLLLACVLIYLHFWLNFWRDAPLEKGGPSGDPSLMAALCHEDVSPPAEPPAALPPGLAAVANGVRFVIWDGRCYQPRVRAARALIEEVWARSEPIRGLSFHPDGRLAATVGLLGHPEFFMRYAPAGARRGPALLFSQGEPVVNLDFAPGVSDPSPETTDSDEDGDSLVGPLAFTTEGTPLFSLGPASPRAVYRAQSADPATIERLIDLGDIIGSLQVPSFDPGYVYVTSRQRVDRYPIASRLTPRRSFPREVAPFLWFGAFREDRRALPLGHSLVLDEDHLLIAIGLGAAPETPERGAAKVTFLLSRKEAEMAPVAAMDLGPMAMSKDGKTRLRYDAPRGALLRFSIAPVPAP